MAGVVKFKKNQIIFREGDESYYMYDILSGTVGVYSGYGTGDEKKLAVLEAGEYFGEMGMIENMPRSATVVALENCELMQVPMELLGDYIEDNPKNLFSIIGHVSSRLRATTVEYVEACSVLSEYAKLDEQGEKINPELLQRMRKVAKSGK